MWLIDANRLYDAAEEKYMEDRGKTDNVIMHVMLSNARQRIQMLIANAPSVDAVPVVRCKDCKWFADNNGGEWYGCKMFQVVRITPEDAPKPDDFCSYGELQMNGGGGSDVSG